MSGENAAGDGGQMGSLRAEPAAEAGHTPDPLLLSVLATQHLQCPGCRYDLFGSPMDTCPECGMTLRLALAGAPRPIAAYSLGLIGLASGWGAAAITFSVIAWDGWLSWDDLLSDDFVVLSVTFAVNSFLIVLWVLNARRIAAAGHGARWLLAAVCWAVTIAAVVVFYNVSF